ncbi:MAG: hypothetical protein J5I81_05565 [Nitrococcus mobilis]|nr:hypothetical protein [Nitrococcus mobilis]
MRIALFSLWQSGRGEDEAVSTQTQGVHIWPRYRPHWGVLRYSVMVALVVAGGLVSPSYAEERSGQTGEASAHAPLAHFQSERRLDEKALSAIHGKGGTGALQPLINLSIILWDEPGRGGSSKPQALAENNFGDPARGVSFNGSNGISISRGK